MINIEKQWDNYFELGKQVIENEISEEALKKEINAFSFFLSELNQDYYYNATYLSNYVMEFLRFLKYFYRKYMFVKQLFKVTSRYQKVSLVIDRYWVEESLWDEEKGKISVFYKVHPSYKKKTVCDDMLLIECSVLCKTQRFIYHSKIEIDDETVQKESRKLREFLEAKICKK
ncbi:MAG: hypothetical protein KHY46_15400 [Clostridiales bacterium]|nr:hypothetical protein [Clostridiales bacterium]